MQAKKLYFPLDKITNFNKECCLDFFGNYFKKETIATYSANFFFIMKNITLYFGLAGFIYFNWAILGIGNIVLIFIIAIGATFFLYWIFATLHSGSLENIWYIELDPNQEVHLQEAHIIETEILFLLYQPLCLYSNVKKLRDKLQQVTCTESSITEEDLNLKFQNMYDMILQARNTKNLQLSKTNTTKVYVDDVKLDWDNYFLNQILETQDNFRIDDSTRKNKYEFLKLLQNKLLGLDSLAGTFVYEEDSFKKKMAVFLQYNTYLCMFLGVGLVYFALGATSSSLGMFIGLVAIVIALISKSYSIVLDLKRGYFLLPVSTQDFPIILKDPAFLSLLIMSKSQEPNFWQSYVDTYRNGIFYRQNNEKRNVEELERYLLEREALSAKILVTLDGRNQNVSNQNIEEKLPAQNLTGQERNQERADSALFIDKDHLGSAVNPQIS